MQTLFSSLTLLLVFLFACEKEQKVTQTLTTIGADSLKDMTEIILYDFTCGDNCYLEYYESETDSITRSALCLAENCEEWEPMGDKKFTKQGFVAYAEFGTAQQFDNEGNVMSQEYPSITKLKITKEERPVSLPQ